MIPGVTIVIPAAGNGARLGLGPKAWLDLFGRPALDWVLDKCTGIASDVIVALPAGDTNRPVSGRAQRGVRFICGGPTRQETVLRLISESGNPVVLLHDVARPFASSALVRRVAEAAVMFGAAGAFLVPDVPVGQLDGSWIRGYFPSGSAAIFQSPQGYRTSELLHVLTSAEVAGLERQSTAQLWLESGRHIRAIPGERTNLKITTPEDLRLTATLQHLLET
jgi:2-C-methyl-D-erythritol 4-phosphate cytidylyltransferase